MPTLLDTDKPVTYGPLDLQDFYFEHKRQQSEAMKNAIEIIPKIMDEFNKKFKRNHRIIEEYKMDDAEVAIVVMSSTAGTTKVVVDDLRKQGLKVGLVCPRLFRPFPAKGMIDALSGLKVVAVLDRAESFSNCGGPLFNDTRAAMYDSEKKPLIVSYIFGLGGRDIFPEDIESVYKELLKAASANKVEKNINYIGVRE